VVLGAVQGVMAGAGVAHITVQVEEVIPQNPKHHTLNLNSRP